jgi:hypothetical protein
VAAVAPQQLPHPLQVGFLVHGRAALRTTRGGQIKHTRARLTYLQPGFRIRIHLIRIRHFRLNTYPDPIRIQGFKLYLQLNFFFIFLDQKLQITYPYASIKDVQVTEEAFSSQKRTSNTSKHEIS